MLKILIAVAFALTAQICFAQVKIGSDTAAANPAVLLELKNDSAAGPVSWKAFLPPKVDFSNAVFSSKLVWGIAGTPTEGAVVYNIAQNYVRGFTGPGIYCWLRGNWEMVNPPGADKIRSSLSTSIKAYDSVNVNDWIMVTRQEYYNLLVNVTGAAQYATPDIEMDYPDYQQTWRGPITVGGSDKVTKVPASSYIIAWSVRTAETYAYSLNSKLKISSSKNSGYTDYGNPLPEVGPIEDNSRVYFVLKEPFTSTPPVPCYTAVHSHETFFLLCRLHDGPVSEYTGIGDVSAISDGSTTDSYSQVICTPMKQW